MAFGSSFRLAFALLAALFVAGSLTAPAARADDASTITDAQAIITAQIDAFKRDDGAAAYGFAAPEIQSFFPSADAFMGMVKGGYQPVYRPRSFTFQPGKITGTGAVQQMVDIIGPDGDYWVAVYALRTMPDGSLKISSCQLVKREGIGA